ncbi:MAG: hypothetical protein WC224_03010 [Sphaerochaetaceae bacterium]
MFKVLKQGVLFVLLALLLTLGSCVDSTVGESVEVRLSLKPDGRFTTRNIGPQGTQPLEIKSYSIVANGPKGLNVQQAGLEESEVVISDLLVGNWTFRATGYNGDGKAIATGESSLYVSKKNHAVEIYLNEEVGTGTFALTYTWNSEQTSSDLQVVFTLFDFEGNAIEDIDASITEGQAVFSKSLAAGFYTIMISLKCDGEIISGQVESLRIIDGTPSEATRELEIGKIVDSGTLTILDGTIAPFEGEITVDNEEYGLGDQVTLILNSSLNLEDYTYKWYCEGLLLEGETNSTLTIDSAVGGATRYDVVIFHPDKGSIGSCGRLVVVEVEPSIVD